MKVSEPPEAAAAEGASEEHWDRWDSAFEELGSCPGRRRRVDTGDSPSGECRCCGLKRESVVADRRQAGSWEGQVANSDRLRVGGFVGDCLPGRRMEDTQLWANSKVAGSQTGGVAGKAVAEVVPVSPLNREAVPTLQRGVFREALLRGAPELERRRLRN